MKIYYFSSGPREKILKGILCSGIKVEKIFVTNPSGNIKIQPTLDIAHQKGIPVLILAKQDLNSFFVELDPQIVCFSAGFKYLFPKKFIDFFQLILNVHGTLLPYYAGACTLNWVLANGEKYSGITVHKVDAGMDTGPILLQEKIPVTPFDTSKSLYRKTLEIEPAVVIKALQMVRDGKVEYLKQNYDNVPIYPNRTPEHSKIDPSKPLINLIDEIRASDPDSYPAFFEYHGQKVGVKLFRLDRKDNEEDTL